MHSIAYGNGKFIAGSGGYIYTSPDGITWTPQTDSIINNDNWYGITYGNGKFVAVGGTYGEIMSSSNGITWSASGDGQIPTNPTNPYLDTWTDVIYDNEKFIAVGDTFGDIITSSDGITWTRDVQTRRPLNAIAYNSSTYASADASGDIISKYTYVHTNVDDSQITINYINPVDNDADSVLVLYDTTSVGDTPTDGVTYLAGQNIGSATIGCVDTTVTPSGAESCTITGLTNGSNYYFALYAKDSRGNYSDIVNISSSPSTPSISTTLRTGTDPLSVTVAPGSSPLAVDAFTLQTSSGNDVITEMTVAIAWTEALSKVEVTNDSGSIIYGSSTILAEGNNSIILNNNTLTANNTPTQYKIRITPKTQASLPTGSLGILYPVTALVSSWTGTNVAKINTDTASSTITIPEETPNANNTDSKFIYAGKKRCIKNTINPANNNPSKPPNNERITDSIKN
jgi:hypothetical protein